ncbi:MAG: ABC transporter substrate-binding protein [Proteobacteria bacterium]|nr:ABC transporter substrate-binding protein [Pseudomonadota bacterium]
MPVSRRRFLSAAVGAAVLAQGCNGVRRAPLRFATNPWPGFDPLYVARDQGFFRDAGLDVSLVDLTSIGAARRAFERGQVDGCGATLVEILLAADQAGLRPQIAAVVDYSNGADVLISTPAMSGPADLRGRRVAIEPGTLHIQLLALALASVGLGIRDVSLVTMPQNAMPEAFAEGQVTAAVCFPPESRRLQELGGKVLFHSGQVPGEVVDTLVFDGGFVARRGAEVEAFVGAYYKAMDFLARHADEALRIMALRENVSVAELQETLAGLRYVRHGEQRELLAADGPVERALDRLQGAMMDLAQLRQRRTLKDFLIARELIAWHGGLA